MTQRKSDKRNQKVQSFLDTKKEDVIKTEQLESKRMLSFLKYFIPSKKREEVLGDIQDTIDDMVEEGVPRWKIRVVVFGTKIGIAISLLLRLRISDYGKTKKQINKK